MYSVDHSLTYHKLSTLMTVYADIQQKREYFLLYYILILDSSKEDLFTQVVLAP